TAEILSHGRVRRRRLGIVATTAALSRSLMRELDLLSELAVEVIDVEPRSPAAKAGIRRGDLIVAVHDRLVTSVDDLHRLLAQFPQDHPLAVTVVRDRVKLELEIHSGE